MTTQTEKLTRYDIIKRLKRRDGSNCMYPDCGKALDFKITEGPNEVTIDHHMPQSVAYAQGWTYEEVWDLTNLKLMHKKCNAKKGDLVPNPDGTLPVKPGRTFKFRRDKRAERPEICVACNSGRNLGPDEVCASCNSGPMPERFPAWAKMKSTECDHKLFWCWACSIGIIERESAASIAVLQGESGEWDNVESVE